MKLVINPNRALVCIEVIMLSYRRTCFVAAALLSTISAQSVVAQSAPLWAQNNSPLAQLVALPSQRSAQLTESWQWELHSAIASHWVIQSNQQAAVRFDGETARVTAALEWGFAPRWSARFSVPWINHQGGFLDPLINDWHALFGMSDAGRPQFADDQLNFRYTTNSNSQSLTRANSGLGDVRTELNYQLAETQDDAWSLSMGYKWATGDEHAWRGSGAGDAYTTLRYSGRHLADLPLTWHGQLGYTYAGESTLLGADQRRHLWHAGMTLDWRLAQSWSLIAQIDGHAGVIRSPLTVLDKPAMVLSLGARFTITPALTLDVSFSEDIRVESAPDITFQATLRWIPSAD